MSIDLVAASLWLDFPPGQKLVLVALCERANLETGECWPGRAEIAIRASVSERSVSAAIAILEHDGWLTTDRQATGPGQTAHRLLSVDRILKEGAKRRTEHQARTRAKSARVQGQRGKQATPNGGSTAQERGKSPCLVTVSKNRQEEPSLASFFEKRYRKAKT